MPALRFCTLLLSLLVITSCSVTHLQHEGSVQPHHFYHEMEFETYRSIIVIPVMVKGNSRNFLFDTGANLTILQQDSITGKSATVGGASNRKVEMGHETVDRLQIGKIRFVNTHAINSPLDGLKDSIPNFGGLIGQSVISKANWLIDYTNQKLQIANYHLADSSFQKIRIERKNGSPYTQIELEGDRYKAMVDLGSSGELTVPTESKLAKQLLSTYAYEEIEKEMYSIGGWQMEKQYLMKIPSIRLGDTEFSNVEVKIKHTSKLRIGIPLFKNHLVYIDNTAGDYKIKRLNKSNI